MIRACFTHKSSSPVSVKSLSPQFFLHLLLDSSSSHFFFLLSHTWHMQQEYYYKFLLIIGTYMHIQKKKKAQYIIYIFLLRESYRVMKKKPEVFSPNTRFSSSLQHNIICTKTWIIHIQNIAWNGQKVTIWSPCTNTHMYELIIYIHIQKDCSKWPKSDDFVKEFYTLRCNSHTIPSIDHISPIVVRIESSGNNFLGGWI